MLVCDVEDFRKEHHLGTDGQALLDAIDADGWKMVAVPNSGCQDEYECILRQTEELLKGVERDHLDGGKIEFLVMDIGIGWCFQLSKV